MEVQLLAHTQLNPQLAADNLVPRGAGTPQENIIEYAGRVCYRSDEKMGYSPTFIQARVREGHEDIIEHVRFVYKIEGAPLDANILQLANLASVEYSDLGGGTWIFSLNARNVRDFWRRSHSLLAAEMARLAQPITPAVFYDLADSGQNTGDQEAGA